MFIFDICNVNVLPDLFSLRKETGLTRLLFAFILLYIFITYSRHANGNEDGNIRETLDGITEPYIVSKSLHALEIEPDTT